MADTKDTACCETEGQTLESKKFRKNPKNLKKNPEKNEIHRIKKAYHNKITKNQK